MNNEILIGDLYALDNEKSFYLDFLKWWESKRILYNLVLLFLEIAIMIYYAENTISFGIPLAVIFTISTNIFANGFYCLGWILEILCYYYFNNYTFPIWLRIALFTIGVLFTILLTLATYIETLGFYIY